MAVGSYAISLRDRARLKKVNPKTIGPTVLKFIGEHPGTSFAALLSATGAPEDLLRASIKDLQEHELIGGGDREYILTERGNKARFVVAS